PITFTAIATNCASSGGVSVSATANGAPVSLTARGDGLYTASYTAAARGAITFAVTGTVGGTASTRSVTGSATQAYPISPGGGPVTLTTTSAGETAQLKFNGTAGERVSLLMSAVSISASQVSLLGPNGATVATTYAGTSGGFMDTKTLPVSGAYTILVDPLGNATGSMTLALYDVPADAGGSITPGGPASSLSISTPG